MLVSRHGADRGLLSTRRDGGEYRAVGTIVISAHLTGPALPAPDAESTFPFGDGKGHAGVFREVSS